MGYDDEVMGEKKDLQYKIIFLYTLASFSLLSRSEMGIKSELKRRPHISNSYIFLHITLWETKGSFLMAQYVVKLFLLLTQNETFNVKYKSKT